MDYKGDLYPCLRYMPSSIGADCPQPWLGNVKTGMVGRAEGSEILGLFETITRRSQHNDFCYNCPINSGCPWCFKAGTLITTDKGDVPVESIKVGDQVLTDEGRYQPVIGNMNRTCDDQLWYVKAGDREWYTTKEHPFWVREKLYPMSWYIHKYHKPANVYSDPKWVEASKLTVNHQLCTADGEWLQVDESVEPDDTYTVYNLTVADDETYYANGVLVHNCSALCHQTYGTANKRVTFHCVQVIAEAASNVYYWNMLNILKPQYNLGVRKNNIPDSWLLKILDQEELDFLKAIEARSMIATIDYQASLQEVEA